MSEKFIPPLRIKIEHAINRCCAENASNTPDFILAEFLTDCLSAWDRATAARERWYGRSDSCISVWSEPVPEGPPDTLLQSGA